MLPVTPQSLAAARAAEEAAWAVVAQRLPGTDAYDPELFAAWLRAAKAATPGKSVKLADVTPPAVRRNPRAATEFFQEWRVADRAASAVEKAVMTSSISSIEGVGDAPGADEINRAKRLRAIANDLFAVSMAEFADRAARAKAR